MQTSVNFDKLKDRFMLFINSYSREYIDECRSKVDLQLLTYKKLVAAARDQIVTNETLLNSAIESFEPNFYNNMVLILDLLFVHRAKILEKKDGNPLNEVSMICNSIMHNHNIMFPDNTIKYVSAKSVLKYRIGDEIKLNEEDFERIFNAFFDEIESKYLA